MRFLLAAEEIVVKSDRLTTENILAMVAIGVVGFIGKKLYDKLDNIDRSLASMSTTLAVHDQKFKDVETRLEQVFMHKE